MKIDDSLENAYDGFLTPFPHGVNENQLPSLPEHSPNGNSTSYNYSYSYNPFNNINFNSLQVHPIAIGMDSNTKTGNVNVVNDHDVGNSNMKLDLSKNNSYSNSNINAHFSNFITNDYSNSAVYGGNVFASFNYNNNVDIDVNTNNNTNNMNNMNNINNMHNVNNVNNISGTNDNTNDDHDEKVESENKEEKPNLLKISSIGSGDGDHELNSTSIMVYARSSSVEAGTYTMSTPKSIANAYDNLGIENPKNGPVVTSVTDSIPSLFFGVHSGSRVTIASTRTKVSTIGQPYLIDNALVVLLCIGLYNGMKNLDGVPRDYDNIINTFVRVWRYKVLYKVDLDMDSDHDDDDEVKLDNDGGKINSDLMYTNDIKVINAHRNYKLYWTGADIDTFVEQTREKVVKNNHNGVIFVISGHGDTDKVLIDSEVETYELEDIFKMFLPEQRSELDTYVETQEESNKLFTIPKIFCIDCCRGNWKAKVTDIHKYNNVNDCKQKSISQTATEDNYKVVTNTLAAPKPKAKAKTKTKTKVKSSAKSNNNTQTKFKFDEKEKENDHEVSKELKKSKKMHDEAQTDVKEKFGAKTISKIQSKVLCAQMTNYCKLWANVEGYEVADGSKNGGIFTRNVSKLFNDKEFVIKHNWTDIILKVREYTKRDSTLYGNLFNFTQIVQDEGTLTRPIQFFPCVANNGGQDQFTSMSQGIGNTASITSETKSKTDYVDTSNFVMVIQPAPNDELTDIDE